MHWCVPWICILKTVDPHAYGMRRRVYVFRFLRDASVGQGFNVTYVILIMESPLAYCLLIMDGDYTYIDSWRARSNVLQLSLFWVLVFDFDYIWTVVGGLNVCIVMYVWGIRHDRALGKARLGSDDYWCYLFV